MWDGKERRLMNSEDHDLLLKIHENTKDLPSRLKEHEAWDDKRFFFASLALVVVASASGVLEVVLSHFKIGG